VQQFRAPEFFPGGPPNFSPAVPPNVPTAAPRNGPAPANTQAGARNVYDFTGEGPAKSRMVAGYISTPDGNTWFLKMTGDAEPVGKAKPDFMTILGSVRLD